MTRGSLFCSRARYLAGLRWLALASLFGCEQVAKLDALYIDRDASLEDAAEPEPEDAGVDEHAELRDLCVDTINTYRATLSLAPLARATREQERCVDQGAETDSAMDELHYTARNRSGRCSRVGLGPENSCPAWHFGPLTENASAADALVHCIDRMWSQGMPPIPVADCVNDLEPGGCYAMHGEWINMTDTRIKFVACGVSLREDDAIWINQDFTAR